MADESNREWVGTPLDIGTVRGQGIERIVVEFDEGEEILTPRLNGRFGSYDLYQAGHYIHALSSHIGKGRDG